MGGEGGDRLPWAAVSAPVLRELWAVPGRVGSAVGHRSRVWVPGCVPRRCPRGALRSLHPSEPLRPRAVRCAVPSGSGSGAVRCGGSSRSALTAERCGAPLRSSRVRGCAERSVRGRDGSVTPRPPPTCRGRRDMLGLAWR